ncbi:uncharacterized protein si:ch211-91p5.3 isoform X2 [Ictalurus punctatus]|uniref:Uncharacterized protein si:ch211-91p5.3 isoform X2 n=1 Tax=Ictalurus punctatus TaxID=7998 RepID=A0A2D0Q524_ICTPU|nr:uncharacterized protein si:ch211-91p5.3 isoform X2 [Ictalurus punctatus]
MDSHKRFRDENYRHWLQTAESLYRLRIHIREFVENETESYHRFLRKELKDEICQSKCSLHKCAPRPKQFPICEKCEKWKDVILKNHKNKGMDIPWNNCQPHLWPTDKWEVAKVYMLRGVKDHHSFDEFDISAILNFMSRCKHFQTFTDGQCINKVISVRNKVMHSPDFRLSKKEMEDSIKIVQELAKILEERAPGLKNLSKEIQQFNVILERCSGQVSQSTSNSKEESLKLINREQHALKEKIEFLAQCYEKDQSKELKEELQGMKNFLDQNKDLLEKLGPQVNRFNEIQEKVDKHEQDISKLHNRVDQLENIVPDPVFSGDVLKFKNYVFEEARRRNMPEPEFTEECEASGYRGIVTVNGRTFRGLQMCNSKRNAHQEVAKIALEHMKSHPEWKEEPTETTSSISSSTSSSINVYYGIVTVVLNNQEVVSDGCVQEEEATESAYRKLAYQFGLASPEASNTFRTAVLEHFQRCNFPKPLELSDRQDDKILCKLQISGPFTFYDKDGSSKKKQAEQQAAKVALQYLSEIINCRSLANAGDNWKGFLKECLDALGLKQPEYDFEIKKVCISQETEGSTLSEDDNSHISTTKVISKNDSLQAKNSVTVVQDLPTADTLNAVEFQVTETLDSSAPEMPSQAPKVDSTGTINYCIVTVVLNNQEVVSDGFVQKEEAIESAYRKLAIQFGLTSLEGKTAVLEYFHRCNFPLPREVSVCEDDKIFCKLQLTGAFTFSDKDGSSKKKQAEQQAAKVALKHLSGLFNCSFEAEAGKNDKGLLKERLEALGLKQPVYSFVINREGDTGELEGPTRSEDNSHLSTTKVISKNDSLQAKNSVTVVQDLPTADTLNAVEFQVTETLDSSAPEMPSQAPKVNSTGTIYYCIVTVVLNNQEVVSDGFVQEEEATESAYRKLAIQFGLTSPEGNTFRTAVLEHFQRCNFPKPLELSDRQDDKILCKLQISGPFTFYDKDGSSKKKQAEQQAAKVALQHLSGLFNCVFEAEAGKNYKGLLKERMDALHLQSPVYRYKVKGGVSEAVEGPGTSGDNLHSSCTTAISKNVCLQPKDNVSQDCLMTGAQDASPDISNKSPKLDYTDINTLLALFHLKPPSITVERVSTEMIFSCHVDINLDKFTFQNNSEYTAKKDAIRKTYLLLGNALGISKPKLDESNASMLVKQHFSQKSLTFPKEVFEDSKCSLNDITYNLVYDGKGATEAEAKQGALQNALGMLPLLFGFKSLPKCSTVEETEVQINTLLRTKGQKDLTYSHDCTLYKSSVELLFKNYTMESKHQKSKKENRNHLTNRILGLLAVEPEPDTVSLRNCLDDWFKQKNLEQPVFENTEEAQGQKVMFSVNVSCSNPNWEESMEVAKEKLVDELRERLKYLSY